MSERIATNEQDQNELTPEQQRFQNLAAEVPFAGEKRKKHINSVH